MKKAAKILCIIALIIGLIWAIVGFFGVWFGGAVVGTVEGMSQNSQAAEATMGKSVNIMLRLLVSFVVVIIGGVLGIVGADKKPSLKPIIFGFLTLICGGLLFPLSNYIAAVLYLVAGLLLVLAGLTTKQVENISEDSLRKKKLILSVIGVGIALVVAIAVSFILKDSPKKQSETPNEVTIEKEEQNLENAPLENDNLGIWKIKYFVDDFGEATKEGYITTEKPIRGEYSLSTAKNVGMQVSFIIESEKSVSIKFYHAGNLVISGYEISYRVLVQDSEGERHTLSASNFNSDRLSFSHPEAKKVYDILLKDGNIKFKIYSNDMLESEYSFTIDNADGLENTMTKLIRNNEANEVSSKTKNEDFESFIQKFTSDKEYQLSRIKFPLRLVKSKDKWEFLSTNDIFKGIKKTKEIALRGEFHKESDNKYRYTLYATLLEESDGYDGGDLNFGLDFSKINGEWMVTDIFYGGEE